MDNLNVEQNNIPEDESNRSLDSVSDNTVYGAVYTPDPEGSGYTCSKYHANNTDTTQKSESIKNEKLKKNKLPIGFVIIAVAVCFVFSALSAVGGAMFAGMFADSQYELDETSGLGNNDSVNESTQGSNNVYIDSTKSPEFVEQTVSQGDPLTMEAAISRVKDSVVEITTETVRSGMGGFSQYVVSGAGSGVIISDGGYIITNNHVIEGAANIIVRLTDGSEHNATLIGTDSKTDIAVLSITPPEGTKLTSAIIGNSDSLLLGETVIAIGNPLGELGGTVTDGIISCLAREIAIDGSGTMTLLQTNAAVSPGNSGGGLFDLYGRLIGIVNAKFSGEGVEGISFAIPVNTAYDIAKQLIDKGYVSGRPALGVTLSQYQYGKDFFGTTYYQVVVVDPQNVTELKVNDVIVSVGGLQISTLGELTDIISNYKIGDVLTLTIIRDRRYVDVNVTLVEYSPSSSEGNDNPNSNPEV